MLRTKTHYSPAIGWVIVGLLLTQLACKTVMGGVVPVATATPLPAEVMPGKSPIPPTDLGTERSGQAGKTISLNPPYQPTAAQGVACIGTFGYGVTCIENQEWHTYTEAEGNLGGDLIHAMTVCPDGSVLTAHTMGLSRYSDREWREYENGWGYGSVEALACGAYSHFWLAHFGGVSHFDGVKWQTYPAVERLLGAPDDPELLDDIAITAEGDVWAVTANSVAWFTHNEWQVFAEGTGFDTRYFLANIALDAQGRPWVSSSRGLLMFDGLTWTLFPNNSFITPEALAVDAEGRVWVGTLSQGIYLFNPDGSWTIYDRENSPLSSNDVRAIVIDGQGRVWIGTAWGVHIIDGDDWHSYRMSNAALADDNIYALTVVNGGPALPEPETKASGSLSGQMVNAAGKALANAPVELCVEKLYKDEYDSSPCGDQPFLRSTTTDAEGRFSFADLPMGRYVLAVNDGGRWRRITDTRGLGSLQVLVIAGEPTELGAVALIDKD